MAEQEAKPLMSQKHQQRLLRELRCEICGAIELYNQKCRGHTYCQKCLERSVFWAAEQAWLASIEKAAYERVRKENATECSTSSPKSE